MGCRDTVVPEIEGQSVPVNLGREGRMGLERSQFGPKEQASPEPAEVQRLLAETIADQVKPVAGDVPQSEGEHPVETGQRVVQAPPVEGGEENLGIGVAPKLHA